MPNPFKRAAEAMASSNRPPDSTLKKKKPVEEYPGLGGPDNKAIKSHELQGGVSFSDDAYIRSSESKNRKKKFGVPASMKY